MFSPFPSRRFICSYSTLNLLWLSCIFSFPFPLGYQNPTCLKPNESCSHKTRSLFPPISVNCHTILQAILNSHLWSPNLKATFSLASDHLSHPSLLIATSIVQGLTSVSFSAWVSCLLYNKEPIQVTHCCRVTS